MKLTKKGRIWGFVGYPDSLPTDWLEKLQQTGLQIAISPLHDKDLDPTGEPKKPHYHIMIIYDGPTTYNHVLELTKSLNCTIPIKLESARGMYRYHIHIDNPEKHQYDDRDRILLNGFDVSSCSQLTHNEVLKIKRLVLDIIKDNMITEYSDLCDMLHQTDSIQMLDVVTSNTVFFNTYLTSARNSCKSQGRTK